MSTTFPCLPEAFCLSLQSPIWMLLPLAPPWHKQCYYRSIHQLWLLIDLRLLILGDTKDKVFESHYLYLYPRLHKAAHFIVLPLQLKAEMQV